MIRRGISLALLLILAAGCSLGAPPVAAPPTPTVSAPPMATPTGEVTSTPAGPVTLRLWLPPEFDPRADNQAGQILKQRLDEFTQRRSGIRVEVRLKALDGAGGLLDSLTTASAVAPLALPDLVALPRSTLETAALKGLVRPFVYLNEPIDDLDWYAYAIQLARVQESTFGIPFAGDALLLVYRPSIVGLPPADLAAALQAGGPLAFPAADPQALFTLALYQAAGGGVRDDQGRPILQADVLERVLNFYLEASQTELIPFWMTQFQNDGESWQAFVEQRAPMVITWASRYLKERQPDMDAAPLPTLTGEAFTLASGWVWALAASDPQRQQLSTELGEYLSAADFLARWNTATGYLPTRSGALQSWSDAAARALARQVVNSAQLYPSEDLLTSLMPALEKATIEVLKQETDPQTAAQEAAQSLVLP